MLDRRIPLAALLLAALPLAGCNPENAPVARLGSDVITLAEFQRVARSNILNFPGEKSVAQHQLLDNMVRRRLMLKAARERGLDTSAVMRDKRARLEERVAGQALADQLAPPAVRVSDAEVERLYQLRRQFVDVSLVYTATETQIREALAQIQGGEPFERVADRYSLAGVMPPGGHIGEVLYGTLVAPLDERMLELRPGAIGGPYRTASGWFLMRVGRRRENTTLEPFAQQRAGLTEALRQRKVRAALGRGLEGVRDAWELKLERDAAATLFVALTPFRLGRDDAEGPPQEQRGQVLATWRGGRYTLGDAWVDLGRDDREKPPYESTDGIEAWVENMCVHRIAQREARVRGLMDQPEVRRRFDTEWENTLLEEAYQLLVADVAPPSVDEIRALWEQQRATLAGRNMPAFDELPGDQQQRVFMMAMGMKRDQALQRVTDDMLAASPPQVFDDRLARAQWPPDPPIDIGGW